MTTAATVGSVTNLPAINRESNIPKGVLRKGFACKSTSGTGAFSMTIDMPDCIIDRVVFDPISGGAAPDNASDWTLKDVHGIDVLLTGGDNVPNDAKTNVVAQMSGANTDFPVPVVGQLTLAGAAMNNSKIMHVYIYYRVL